MLSATEIILTFFRCDVKNSRIFSKEEYHEAFRYCLSFTEDADDAFDLLQTAFEKLLKKNVQTLENPKTYFYRIIRNQFIDDQRKKQRWNWEEFEETNSIALFKIEQLDELVMKKDQIAHLLKNVSPAERELLYLSAVEGYSIQEISDLQQIPKGTLLSRLYRLKLKIRDQFSIQTEEAMG